MFATISVRIEPFQQFLATIVQQKLVEFPNTPDLARERRRVALDAIDPAAPEHRMDRQDAVREVVLVGNSAAPGARSSFFVTGVLTRSITLYRASIDDQVPFRVSLPDPQGPTLPRIQQAQSFRVGLEIQCALDVRIDAVDGSTPAIFTLLFTWMLGINEQGPLFLGAGDPSTAAPKRIGIATLSTLSGVALPLSLPASSPLCQIAADFIAPTRSVLQVALLEGRNYIRGLGALLPNEGVPVADAVFLTDTLGATAPPLETPQFRYVAQVTDRVSDEQAILGWRRMLVDRPETVIPEERDLIVETEGRLIVEGMTPGFRSGVTGSLSTIAFGIWKSSYFEGPRRPDPASVLMDLNEAVARVNRFRGDPSATPAVWLDTILEPWRTVVRAMAASRRDTEGLLGRGTPLRSPELVAAALNLLEARLFGPLEAQFEGIAGPLASPLGTDTTPPSAPPTVEEIVAAFLRTPSPVFGPPAPTWAGAPVTLRDVYDDLRQARLVVDSVGLGSPTRRERAQARQYLRSVYADCEAFRAFTSLPPSPPVARPGPGVVSPLAPTPLIDTIVADRRLDVFNRTLRSAIETSRRVVPSVVDIGQAAFDEAVAANTAATNFLNTFNPNLPSSRGCRVFSAVANSDGPEPLPIQQVDLLRFIEIVDGTAVRWPRSEGAIEGYQREVARGLRHVSFHEIPTVSVDPDGDALVIRMAFAIRLAGIIQNIGILWGDDLIAFSETTIRVEFVLPPGVPPPTEGTGDERSIPGPSRTLRIGVSPRVSVPIGRQPTGEINVITSLLVTVIINYLTAGLAAGVVGAVVDVGAPIGLGVGANALQRVDPGVGDLDSFLRPILQSIAGPGRTPPQPQQFAGSSDLVYSFPNFEAGRFGPAAVAVGVSSGRFTINARGGRVRFTALWPNLASQAVALWAQRQLVVTGIDPFSNVVTQVVAAIVWSPCAVIADARRRVDEAAAQFLTVRPCV